MKTEKHYYHCASKGLEAYLLFSSRKEFIAGMNRVGFCLLKVPDVIIIAFVLMDNHVHFILYGTEEDCFRFMAEYKKLTSYYYINNSEGKLLDYEYDCWLISNREKLKEKICYVLRNPLAAGIRILPTNYSWGSGSLMFNEKKTGFLEIGETSEYYRRKMFGTKREIPESWLINEEGLIWPGSYVEFKRAESSFDSMVDFMFELNRRNEESINQEMYGNEINLNDNDVLVILADYAERSFGERSLTHLNVSQRLDLIQQIRRSHGVGIKQLGRLLHLRQQDLKLIWQ